jgi:hypothetical protein
VLPGTNYSEQLIPEFHAYREFWVDIRPELMKTYDEVSPDVKASLDAIKENRFGAEEVGSLVGLWFGLSYGLATLPVVALDGPLPFLDAAWAFATFRVTRRAVSVGKEVGKFIDEVIA